MVAHVGNMRASRICISERTKRDAKGVVWQAIQALSLAAEMAQGVPYLGAISAALMAFMKIQDEVHVCKDECNVAMDYAQQIGILIVKFRDECVSSGRGESAFAESLCSTFTNLESIVLDSIEVLIGCRLDSSRFLDRIRIYFKRSELTKSVKDCSRKMHQALEMFNTTLQVDQVFLLEGIRVAVDEMRETVHSMASPRALALDTMSQWRLRIAPVIFHGRESEVTRAVELIVKQAPARIAILGPGGIGKTSIALSVLHAPEVGDLYGQNRCFVSCEAITTADGIVRVLADSIGLTVKENESAGFVQHNILNHLKTSSGIICFDNLETPLEADKHSVEALLDELSVLPSMAFLITSRDTSIPTIRWTMPALEHIKPFSLDAALHTWDDICNGHDEYALKLIGAVDRMPLAVNILARLAVIEDSAMSIWDRWESERTDLIRAGHEEHRLYNVAASIELSLRSLGSPSIVDVLSLICIFPGGLTDCEMEFFRETTQTSLPVRQALTHLKQHSLIYTENPHPKMLWFNNPVIRVLSPIRLYMLQHHPVSDDVFLSVADIVQEELYPESMDAYVNHGFQRGKLCRERCLKIVEEEIAALTNVETAYQVVEMAREVRSASLPAMYRRFSQLWESRDGFEKARFYYARRIELNEQSANWRTLLEDYMGFFYLHCRESRKRQVDSRHMDELGEVFGKATELLHAWKIPYDHLGFLDPRYIRDWLRDGVLPSDRRDSPQD